MGRAMGVLKSRARLVCGSPMREVVSSTGGARVPPHLLVRDVGRCCRSIEGTGARPAHRQAWRYGSPSLSAAGVTDLPLRLNLGGDMGKEDKPKRVKCGACFGEGGNWEELNGTKGKERKWNKCRTCGGSGWVDS